MRPAALTFASDVERPMPLTVAQQLDSARAAVASLESEQRRVERLGFEIPMARCHQQLRYWRFVESLLALRAVGESR